MIPRDLENGIPRASKPGKGSDLYPIERNDREAGTSMNSPVPFAVELASEGSMLVFSQERLPSCSGAEGSALKDVGVRQKSRDQDLVADDSGTLDPFFSKSIRRFGGRSNTVVGRGNKTGSMGWNATEGRFRSSRASLIVKAACHVQSDPNHWSLSGL